MKPSIVKRVVFVKKSFITKLSKTITLRKKLIQNNLLKCEQ
jgi:hypothetical protein